VNSRAENTYHHGDLPATLMDLALVHIGEEGTEKLSLRALAREAGVSPTAPYRHFPSKRCLLAALATRGFRQLQAINEAHESGRLGLETAFVELGMGYVRFAVENATTYQIMFGSVIDDFNPYPDLADAAEASYRPLQKTIDALKEQNPDLNLSPEMLGGIIWAMVHGVASLLIYGQSRPDDETRAPGRAMTALAGQPEAALRILYQGLLNNG